MPGVYGSAEPLFLLLFALGVEAIYGGSVVIDRWLPRPRRLMAVFIRKFDGALNRSSKSSSLSFLNGSISVILIAIIFGAAGYALSIITRNAPFLWLIEVFFIAFCLDHRAHQVRLRRVRKALALKSLVTARGELYPLVSTLFRLPDLNRLNESQMAVVSVGGMARGFVTGFVAPALWYGLLGLPGLFVQQAVHQGVRFYRQRHLQAPLEHNFSRAFMAFDQVLLVLPDALSALLFICASIFVPGTSLGQAFSRCWRGKRMADAALGGALRLNSSGPSESNWRRELERGNLVVLIAGIMGIGLIAGAVLLRFTI
ncbi:cobalamin biosynthesis protein [Kiloniella antarctica]|uniref:Cobalamin biosynthesis protein n=1 Tax=Kiloniella antarctica TaxID=1550907 RepID=A0ABW5BJZ2_9PROT